MSEEIYFKNPYRGRKVKKPKAYRPEHEKLGLEPVQYPLKDPEEFERMNKKIAAENKKEKKGKDINKAAKEAVDKFRNGELNKEQLEEALQALYNAAQTVEIAANPTPSTIVPSSGQSEDLQWTAGLGRDDREELLAEASDNEEIRVEEVPDPPKSPYVSEHKELEEEAESLVAKLSSESDEEESSEFSFDQVKNGEYVLLYQNSVIGIGKLDYIKDTLSNILMEGNSEDSMSVNDFVVMKKVSVSMGVSIDG